MFHLNNTKKNSLKYFPEENLKESINKYFSNTINLLSSNIDYLLDKLVFITFIEIKRVLVVQLFKWPKQKDVGGEQPGRGNPEHRVGLRRKH